MSLHSRGASRAREKRDHLRPYINDNVFIKMIYIYIQMIIYMIIFKNTVVYIYIDNQHVYENRIMIIYV